jgi:hypothetical protein
MKKRKLILLVDVNNDEISVKELVDKYLGNPEDYFIYTDDKIRTDLELKNKQEEKKDNTLEKAESEEHISNPENTDKLDLSSINNENNRLNDSPTIQENVLLTKKEQIEHYPPSSLSSSLSLTQNKVLSTENEDREASSVEYVYGNDEDANEEVSSQDVQ